jgi:hypothetical protein
MRFELPEVPLQQIIIRLMWFSPVRFTPQIRHTHLLNSTHNRRKARQILGTFIEGIARTESKALSYSYVLILQSDTQ